jgi:hypothetical protein
MCLWIAPWAAGLLAALSSNAPSAQRPVSGPIEFEEIAAQSGINFSIDSSPTPNKNQIEATVAGVALIDHDNDVYQDIFFANGAAIPSLKKEGPQYKNRLYHNNGDGTFTDVTTETGIAQHLGRGMGVAIADYDGDGFMDIFVANDDSPNFLFHNIGGKRFEEVAVPSWVAYNPSGKTTSAMGADFRDLNNDGRPHIWFTALPTEMFPLFLNRGAGAFDDATRTSGLAWATQGMAGWSNAIVDLDNDGWKDLFAVERSCFVKPLRLSRFTRLLCDLIECPAGWTLGAQPRRDRHRERKQEDNA